MWGNKIELFNDTGADVDLIEVLRFAPPGSSCHVLRLPPNSRRLVSGSFYCDRNRNSGRSSYIIAKFIGGEAEETLMPESFRKYNNMRFFVGCDGKPEIKKSMNSSDDFQIWGWLRCHVGAT